MRILARYEVYANEYRGIFDSEDEAKQKVEELNAENAERYRPIMREVPIRTKRLQYLYRCIMCGRTVAFIYDKYDDYDVQSEKKYVKDDLCPLCQNILYKDQIIDKKDIFYIKEIENHSYRKDMEGESYETHEFLQYRKIYEFQKAAQLDGVYDDYLFKYKSIQEMCLARNVDYFYYLENIKNGKSQTDIFQNKWNDNFEDYIIGCCVFTHDKRFPDEYASLNDICQFYGISHRKIIHLLKMSDSPEEYMKQIIKIGKSQDNISVKENNGIRYVRINNLLRTLGIDEISQGLSPALIVDRLNRGWSLKEATGIPKGLYIGELRVAAVLDSLSIEYYKNKSLKTIFNELNFDIPWNELLNELSQKLHNSGIEWSKSKIEKLRPDFVLLTDNGKLRGVIEFDGQQHINFVEYFFKTIEMFLKRQNSDFAKNTLWEYLETPMLRIRYDQIDFIEKMIKDFLENPANYIQKHNTYLTEEEYWEPKTKEKLIYQSCAI